MRDFHTHSNNSDGLYSPHDLVVLAAQSGVQELSLTDHDALAGLGEAQVTAAAHGIGFLPGLEITTRLGEGVVHMLGYGFEPSVALGDKALIDYLGAIQEKDHAWAYEMCRKSLADPIIVRMPQGGEHRITVTEEDLGTPGGTAPSAFHLAVVVAHKLAELSPELAISARHCLYLLFGRLEAARWDQSFWPEIRERYRPLCDRYGIEIRSYWWTPRPTGEMLSAPKALATIARIGGLPVLAHPGEQRVTARQIEQLVCLGLRGVEAYSYKHTPQQVTELESLADRLGLIITVGTDYHDPHHRGAAMLGRDGNGAPLEKGASLADLGAMGACVYAPSVSP